MWTAGLRGLGLALLLSSLTRPIAAEEGFSIGLPIACEFGNTCFVQQYVDRDRTSGLLDYACGAETYDGHDGVDIRILSAASSAKGVKVLAPADGVVSSMRDGMPDQLVVDEPTRLAVAGKECGNGVVLKHIGGWQTQLCHLKQGSITVKTGEHVSAGEPIGSVGYSGLAAFSHVHITVRDNGIVIDPFTGTSADQKPSCPRDPAAKALWTEKAAQALTYRTGAIIETGFAATSPSPDELERIGGSVPPPTSTDKAFLFYGRFINLMTGDVIHLTVTGPEMSMNATSDPLPRAEATYVSFVGRKLSVTRWPPGKYNGRAELVRSGQVIESRGTDYEMPN